MESSPQSDSQLLKSRFSDIISRIRDLISHTHHNSYKNIPVESDDLAEVILQHYYQHVYDQEKKMEFDQFVSDMIFKDNVYSDYFHKFRDTIKQHQLAQNQVYDSIQNKRRERKIQRRKHQFQRNKQYYQQTLIQIQNSYQKKILSCQKDSLNSFQSQSKIEENGEHINFNQNIIAKLPKEAYFQPKMTTICRNEIFELILGNMPMFPGELWMIILCYLGTYEIIKLERTCKSLFCLINTKCKKCSNDELAHNCSSIWRIQYYLMNQPFFNKYAGVSCRGLRFLCIRKIILFQFERRISQIQAKMCKKGKHIYNPRYNTKKQINLLYCQFCGRGFSLKSVCLNHCPIHLNSFCKMKLDQFSKSHSGECYCALCFALKDEELKRNIGFIFGLERQGIIDFNTGPSPQINFFVKI